MRIVFESRWARTARAKLWENGAARPQVGSCHEKPAPRAGFKHLAKAIVNYTFEEPEERAACIGCRADMVEKCGDHLIDSARALNYDPGNLLLLHRVAGTASPDLRPPRHVSDGVTG
jgi:hypothetical protein